MSRNIDGNNVCGGIWERCLLAISISGNNVWGHIWDRCLWATSGNNICGPYLGTMSVGLSRNNVSSRILEQCLEPYLGTLSGGIPGNNALSNLGTMSATVAGNSIWGQYLEQCLGQYIYRNNVWGLHLGTMSGGSIW
jgi:hypothetical protein